MAATGQDLMAADSICAPLCIDHVSMTSIVTGQHISVLELPEFVRERISRQVELPHSIPELLDAANSADRTGESLRLLPTGSADLVAYMNRSGLYDTHFQDLYWKIPPPAMRAVVERVCTDVVGLVGEMRSGMNRGQGLPSPDIANQAFNVVVKGTGNRVVLKKVRQESKSSSPDESPGHRMLKVMAWLAGIIAAMATVVILYLQLAG